MKYFIDCGGHFGEGLKHFIDQYNVDKTWRVFTFEPNKESYEILKNFSYKEIPITVLNSGIWIKNDKLKFNPETCPQGDKTGSGSTFIDQNDWNIKIPGNSGAGDFNESYEIDVIDLSAFLESLSEPEFVLVKMDIEGSEYTVLRHLIEKRTIQIINDLHCEFHDWAMKSETKQTTDALVNEIKNLGVNINRWI